MGATGTQRVRPPSREGCPTPPIHRARSSPAERQVQPAHPCVLPTSSLTFRGLRHGRAQTVHVVTPITVITEQQLVLGVETRPAGTLGARAPETGVGGWGRGQSEGQGEVGPSTRKGSQRSLHHGIVAKTWPSKPPVRLVSLQFVVWVLQVCGTLNRALSVCDASSGSNGSGFQSQLCHLPSWRTLGKSFPLSVTWEYEHLPQRVVGRSQRDEEY